MIESQTAGSEGSEIGPLGTNSSARRAATTVRLAEISALSALVALGTILSNFLLGFSLPPPLTEITVAPAFYMAIAVLFPRKVSLWSTAIGSAVGEAFNLLVFGPASVALSFVPGIVIARAPESLIIARFREKTAKLVILGMALATIYETLAFFFIDWPIYSFTAFYGPLCTPPELCIRAGLLGGFLLASLDFGTLIDLVWIPVALVLIRAVRRAFNVKFFD